MGEPGFRQPIEMARNGHQDVIEQIRWIVRDLLLPEGACECRPPDKIRRPTCQPRQQSRQVGLWPRIKAFSNRL